MKSFKFLLVAVAAMVCAQVGWAMNPGLAPGGGSEAAPATQEMHASQGVAGPMIDESTVAPAGELAAQPAATQEVTAPAAATDAAAVSTKAEAPAKLDKKSFRQNLKDAVKASRQAGEFRAPKAPMAPDQIVCVIVALFIPFLGVLLWFDGITKEFWISLILTLLFFFPGLIYSLYVILS